MSSLRLAEPRLGGMTTGCRAVHGLDPCGQGLDAAYKSTQAARVGYSSCAHSEEGV